MKFEPSFLKFLHFLDIQGSYLHAVMTFYTYLLGISSDKIVIIAWNGDIVYSSVTVILIFIEFSVMWPYVKRDLKSRWSYIYFCATVKARRCIVSHTYLLYF